MTVIAHHGVKGQKWGVRRSRGSDGTVGSGGRSGHPASSDAAKANEIHTRVKSAGTHTVSNQDLQHLVTRMNLEQQYSKLSSSSRHAGAKLAEEILTNVGKQQLTKLISDGVTSVLK